jgi:hypothetical protein
MMAALVFDQIFLALEACLPPEKYAFNFGH